MARRPGVLLTAIVVLAAGTAVTILTTPAPSPGTARPARAGTAASRLTAPVRAELAAIEQASKTGRKVVVASMTTPVSQVVANPNGSLTETDYAQPVRVHQHGTWQPVNPDLRHGPSGSLEPTAVTSGISLSSGGTGPLAVLATTAGQQLSLYFPARLPAPAVSGATATYRSVWPGTDLRVSVTSAGGLTWAVIIRDAAAAANPALRHLKLRLTSNGLAVTADTAGNLRAAAADGTVVFSAPPATMQDSGQAPASPAHRSASAASASAKTGPALRSALVPARIAGNVVTLVPVAPLLSAAATYPVQLISSITPDVTAAPAGQSAAASAIRGSAAHAGASPSASPRSTGSSATSSPSPADSSSPAATVIRTDAVPTGTSSSTSSGSTLTATPAGSPDASATAAGSPSATSLNLGVTPESAQVSTTPNCETIANQDQECSGSSNGFVEVQKGCPTAKNYDVSQDENGNSSYPGNGIGYNWWDSCIGVYRSYYQFDSTGLEASTLGTTNVWVQNSTLYAWVRYSADWTCSDTWPVSVKWTGPISASTTWNNQPAVDASNQTKTYNTKPGPNPNSSCAQQTLDFDVTYAMTHAASTGAANMTFGFYGNETASSSTSNIGFMRIGNNPYIVTTFDVTPDAPPTPLTTSPGSKFGPDQSQYKYGCVATNTPGAMNSGLPWINASTVNLQAHISTPISSEQVRAFYSMWNDTEGQKFPAANVTQYQGFSENWFSGSGDTSTPMNPSYPLKDGMQYTWTAQSYVSGIPTYSDSGYYSADGPVCGFNVDYTQPDNPTVTSTDFPASGTGQTGKDAGASGTFAFSSADPDPCGACSASGVYEFAYSLNQPVATSAATSTQTGCGAASATAGIVLADSSGHANSCPVTAGLWGTNILYVEAIDRAGNVSGSVTYYFYTQWNPNKPVVPGDVNGDGIPDLLATNGSDLTLYIGNTDPSVKTATSSFQADSPDGSPWSDYQIAHRGPLSQNTASADIDDLFAHKSTGSSLYLYENNPASPGATPQFADTSAIVPLMRPSCTGAADYSNDCADYPTARDWSAATSILGPGDAWNPTPSTAGSASPSDNGQPSLLTVENGKLWLYQGTYAPGLQDPIELGSSGWDGNISLLAPGTVAGRLTIWAYDNSTGNLYSYPVQLVDNVPSLSASGTPIAADTGTPVFTNPTPGTTVAVASPGALGNSSYPGLFIASQPAGSYTGKGYGVEQMGSVTDPTGTKTCANGCLWYYDGQATSNGTAPLKTTPIFVGDLNTGLQTRTGLYQLRGMLS